MGHRYWAFEAGQVQTNGSQVSIVQVEMALYDGGPTILSGGTPLAFHLDDQAAIPGSAEGHGPEMAVDGDPATYWQAVSPAIPVFWGYDFGETGIFPFVQQFKITARSDDNADSAMVDIVLLWSDTGEEWTSYSEFNQGTYTPGETKTYTIDGATTSDPGWSGPLDPDTTNILAGSTDLGHYKLQDIPNGTQIELGREKLLRLRDEILVKFPVAPVVLPTPPPPPTPQNMAFIDSKQLLILKALTSHLELLDGIDVQMQDANGYPKVDFAGQPELTQKSLLGRVYRGRTVFGQEETDPFLSILEGKRPDQLPAEVGYAKLLRDEDWHLLIQGFMLDDEEHPLDNLYRLKGMVERQLSRIVATKPNGDQPMYPDEYLLGGLIIEILIGPGVVRPSNPAQGGTEAFFLPVVIRYVMNVADPYSVE